MFESIFSAIKSALSSKKMIIFKDEADVEREAKKRNRVWLMYKGSVYDATKYLEKHPGGTQLIAMANCKVIDKVFDKYHYPLGDAPKIMKKMKIGEIHREET